VSSSPGALSIWGQNIRNAMLRSVFRRMVGH
jgi:hypothetical protein